MGKKQKYTGRTHPFLPFMLKGPQEVEVQSGFRPLRRLHAKNVEHDVTHYLARALKPCGWDAESGYILRALKVTFWGGKRQMAL